MFSICRPTYRQLNEFLWKMKESPFTYPEVGRTREKLPDGYTVGRERVRLGEGRVAYLKAKAALREWKMFPEHFVDVIWPGPIEVGRVVATLFHAPGFWTLNPCKIVYTIDDLCVDGTETSERYGFAYGTVGNHLACGEEKFVVQYDHADGSVWYEVTCFSRADHWLSILAYPYLRLQQHRFRKLSGLAMQAAVGVAAPLPQAAVA